MTTPTIQAYDPQQAQQQEMEALPAARPRGLSFVIHGGPKSGKSTAASSGPAPRVILDAEFGSHWAAGGRKVDWDPTRTPPPQPGRHVTVGYGPTAITAAWESAMVAVHDASTVNATYRWLNSGQHPFNSSVMDSITEVQQRWIDDLAGSKQMQRDDWGALLRNMNRMTREWRDLISHPVRPLWSIAFIAGTRLDSQTGKWRPMVQGQAGDHLPYYVDVLGYIAPAPDGTRHLLIGPHPQYETGERVGGRLPMSMQLEYPPYGIPGYSLSTMIQQVIAS